MGEHYTPVIIFSCIYGEPSREVSTPLLRQVAGAQYGLRAPVTITATPLGLQFCVGLLSGLQYFGGTPVRWCAARFPVLSPSGYYVPVQREFTDFRDSLLGLFGAVRQGPTANVLAPRSLVAVARVGGPYSPMQQKPELLSLADSGASR